MKQTLSGTQMLVKTTSIFHSGHVTILLFFETDANVVGTYCGWTLMPAFEELYISEKLLQVHFSSNQKRTFNWDCIVSDMEADFYFLSVLSRLQREIITYYYQMQSVVESQLLSLLVADRLR